MLRSDKYNVNGKEIEVCRVNNDVNGNPRYVFHFLAMDIPKDIPLDEKYAYAIKQANKMGGRKFHNRQYGGGIVFQSYSVQDDLKRFIKGGV